MRSRVLMVSMLAALGAVLPQASAPPLRPEPRRRSQDAEPGPEPGAGPAPAAPFRPVETLHARRWPQPQMNGAREVERRRRQMARDEANRAKRERKQP
jgi:hypothetical protein